MDHVRVPYQYPRLQVDASHAASPLDHNRCVLCGRCVRVCDEIEGAHTWDMMGRGVPDPRDHRPQPALGRPRDLHQLRQVRARLPHRRAVRKGQVGGRDGQKRRQFLPYLSAMREKRLMTPARVATVWLDGCSGCHMSFLDMDERLLEIAPPDRPRLQPAGGLQGVPGGGGRDHRRRRGQQHRGPAQDPQDPRRTKILVSLGDCAVTSNVPGMRNPSTKDVLERAYVENVHRTTRACPTRCVPPLLPQSRPVHEYVKVDVFVPGCPPNADAIFYAVSELLAGRMPDPAAFTRFG
jgi:NAD-reducing hydrogenase small subunit